MQLNSVRELKKSLPEHLEKTFSSEKGAMRLASTAVAMAAVRRPAVPSYFLGVAAKGKKDYRLAVRLQDHALEKSVVLDEISKRARGEVDVRYVGRIWARKAKAQAAAWYQSKSRPLLIGSSIGFISPAFVMAGTLGCFVRKGKSKALYILSNNHVLADENRQKKGDPITQPGPLDGGNPATDGVAKLSAFVRLTSAATNFVDCAIAKLDDGIAADTSTLRGIGALTSGVVDGVQIGDQVDKVGRTTGVRHGRVTAIELDGVTVQYDIGVLSFDNQVEIEGAGPRSFSDAGDSGSLIVNDQLHGVALLFAGGDHGGSNGKGLTFANPLGAVLAALKVQLAT